MFRGAILEVDKSATFRRERLGWSVRSSNGGGTLEIGPSLVERVIERGRHAWSAEAAAMDYELLLDPNLVKKAYAIIVLRRTAYIQDNHIRWDDRPSTNGGMRIPEGTISNVYKRKTFLTGQ